MRQRLEGFLTTYETWRAWDSSPTSGKEQTIRNLEAQLRTDIPTVKEILDRLQPNLSNSLGRSTFPKFSHPAVVEHTIRQGLGILRDRPEWRTRLAPEGAISCCR